jgi:hypothetical protein
MIKAKTVKYTVDKNLNPLRTSLQGPGVSSNTNKTSSNNSVNSNNMLQQGLNGNNTKKSGSLNLGNGSSMNSYPLMNNNTNQGKKYNNLNSYKKIQDEII